MIQCNAIYFNKQEHEDHTVMKCNMITLLLINIAQNQHVSYIVEEIDKGGIMLSIHQVT